MKITLKANEKIYINGAVLRTDRKVSLELLNDVQFLLETHVIQADEASTPLKQLYFVLQIMLVNPKGSAAAEDMFHQSLPMLLSCFSDQQILSGLKHVDRLVAEGQIYEALKTIRSLYPREAEIMNLDARVAAEAPRLALAVGA